MNEPEVVQRVHRFLSTRGLNGERMSRLFTDPHPTLTGMSALRPFQRFAIGDEGFVHHPDLLGQQSDSDSLVAVEAKGDQDLLKGIAQAEVYQQGVQLSLLAAPAAVLNDSLVRYAREKGVGVIAVGDEVTPLHVPAARRPLNALYNALRSDIGLASWIADDGTFVFNLPTHYLVWAAALRGRGRVGHGEARRLLGAYPMPRDIGGALRGARKLGIVVIDGDTARLSDAGEAVACLLPNGLDEWASIHREIASARGQLTLSERCPAAAAVLRLLLLRDPVVQQLLEGLRVLGPDGGHLVQLAQACWRLDRHKALILFLKPESLPAWVSRHGEVDWFSVQPSDFRSTTFFQYKSVLRHSGLIVAHALGSASARDYQPLKDRWQLNRPLWSD